MGDLIVVVILWRLWKIEQVEHKKELKLILAGIIVFIIAAGFDQWWHHTFGIDLTTWSPTHFALYTGTLIAQLGALLYISRDYVRHQSITIRLKRIYSLIFFILIFDSFWFPLLQQEQGVITKYLLGLGVVPFAPDLSQVFFSSHVDPYGGIPLWVYGAWAAFSLALVLTLVKRLDLHRYGATLVAGGYLAFRIVMNAVFALVAYPTSTIPYYILIVAILFDYFFDLSIPQHWKESLPLLTTVLIVNGVGLIATAYPTHPPIPLETILPSIAGVVIGALIAHIAYKKVFRGYL